MTLSYSGLMSKSWDAFKDQLPLTAGLTLVYFAGVYALSQLSYVGGFLTGPFTAGYMICLLKIKNKQTIDYKDVFWGFMDMNRLGQLILSGIITGFLSLLGFILLLVPGIWFLVSSFFTTAFIVLDDTDAVSAVKKSLAATKHHWWFVVGLIFVMGILNIIGALCFLLGLLVTVPLMTLMLLEAAQELRAEVVPGATASGTTFGSSVMNVNPMDS